MALRFADCGWAVGSATLRAWRHSGDGPKCGFVVAVGTAALALAPPAAYCYSYEELPDGSPDRLKKWRTSWSVPVGTNPGFHLTETNPLLRKYFDRATRDLRRRDGEAPAVLLPLCGKTLDMLFFASHGFRVVGVEGIQRAIIEFREEQRCQSRKKPTWMPLEEQAFCVEGLKTSSVVSPGFEGWRESVQFLHAPEFAGERHDFVYKTGKKGQGYYRDSPKVWHGTVINTEGEKVRMPLDLIQGDMFSVTPSLVDGVTSVEGGRFDFAFDRGSIVALPPSARESYVAVCSDLIKEDGRILMVTVEYDQAKVEGPPYSIPVAEVQRLFPREKWVVEALGHEESDVVNNPRFKQKGVGVTEHAILITRRNQDVSSPVGKIALASVFAAGSIGIAFACGLACR